MRAAGERAIVVGASRPPGRCSESPKPRTPKRSARKLKAPQSPEPQRPVNPQIPPSNRCRQTTVPESQETTKPQEAPAPRTQLVREKKKNPTPVAGLVSSAEAPKAPRRNLGDHPTTNVYIRHNRAFVNKIPTLFKINFPRHPSFHTGQSLVPIGIHTLLFCHCAKTVRPA